MAPVPHRSDSGVLHVDRRRKIGLSDAEGDDVRTAADQPVDFGQHDERVLGAEGLGAATELGHGGRL